MFCKEKVFISAVSGQGICPISDFLFFIYLFHWKFPIIKQNVILDEDNLRKYKMQYLNYDFIC